MKQTYYFNENEKLSTMVTQHPGLLPTLSHFGIPLGFGDKSIKEVCHAHHVDPQFFLLICNVYSFDDFIPSLDTIHATNMDGLVPYLTRSHASYLNKRLPHIGGHLSKLSQLLPARAAAAINAFYGQYLAEVRSHFENEETRVFPHIVKLQERHVLDEFSIAQFLDSHENLEVKLSDLVQIIFKYLPGRTDDDDAIEMIFDIILLANDLHKHSLIEEKILGPYVKHLEKSLKR